MNTEHFERVLLRRQSELRKEMAAFQGEARQSPADVEDPIDEATSSQGKASALQENTLAADALRQVDEALQRISEGTYGHCVDCGREIEPARLKAVPWTPYCLRDQQKHDAENPPTGSLTL